MGVAAGGSALSVWGEVVCGAGQCRADALSMRGVLAAGVSGSVAAWAYRGEGA